MRLHGLPTFVEAGPGQRRCGCHRRHPAVVVHPQNPQRTAVFGRRAFRRCLLITVGFVDDQHVGEFDDTPLDTLEFVAGAAEQQQQERVDQLADGDFGLADADRLDEHDAVTGRLAELHDLARTPRDAAEGSTGG